MARRERPSDQEIDAAAEVLCRAGRHHHWFPKGAATYAEMGSIERSEFGGIVEQMLMAAQAARPSKSAESRMTPAERLVGRKMPKPGPHIDTLMASFVKADGTFSARLKPVERWLAPAHKKARQNGWIRSSGVRIGFGDGPRDSSEMFHLTPTGEIEATAAHRRTKQVIAAQAQWSRDHGEALRNSRTSHD